MAKKPRLPAGNRQDPEVRAPTPRRQYTQAYKEGIIRDLKACTKLGEKTALLRKEGLYYSTVSRWRQQMARKNQPPQGRPPKSDVEKENEQLRRRVSQLERELERACSIIDVQKKLSELLVSLSTQTSGEGSR